MKKNAMLKIAAILMVAVLLTTCAISSTFAKYVTSDSATAAAGRVAAFGYTLDTAVTTEAFAETYATDDPTYKGSGEGKIANSVISLSGAVVAPGTSGSLVYTSGLTAAKDKAEVAVEIKSTATFAVEGFTEEYFPIVFTVGSSVYKHNCLEGGTFATTSALIDQLNKDLSFTKLIPAGTEKTDVQENFADKTVAWAWAFNNVAADADSLDVDAADTALGNAGTATIAFSVNQSITQID